MMRLKRGVEKSIIQDIDFKVHITEFHREVYYSPSEKKRYVGKLPPGYKGEFGPGVKSLVCVLYHDANVSEPGIVRLKFVDPAESRMSPDGAERANGRPFLIRYWERQFQFH